MGFYEKAGDVFLRQRANNAQNLDALQRMTLHGINQGQQLHLRHVSEGLGIDPSTQPYLKPYGVEPDMNVTNNYTPPTPAAQPASGGFLKGLGVAALVGSGLGMAGAGSYFAIDKALSNLPAKVAPAVVNPINLDIKWHNDPDKGGIVFDEVKPK